VPFWPCISSTEKDQSLRLRLAPGFQGREGHCEAGGLTTQAACANNILMKKDIREFLKKIAAKGGKAGTGKSKIRGDASYYSRIGKISARKKKGK
jgi:hypothetical protein